MNFTGVVAVGTTTTTIDTIIASAALAASSTSTTSHFHELEPHIGISFECCQLHSGKVVQFVWMPLQSLDELKEVHTQTYAKLNII